MGNYIPPQYADEATPRGALVRMLESKYPHSVPATTAEIGGFLAQWLLNQDSTRPALGLSEAIATLENWYQQRRAVMS